MFRMCSASLAGTVVNTLQSMNWSNGVERLMLAQAKNHQAEFALVMRQLAQASITTHKIDAIAAPIAGASNVIFVDVAQAGTAGTSYRSIAGGATTIVIPRRINWSAGQPAALEVAMLFLSSNGTTAPCTVGTTAGGLTAAADFWVGSGTGISSIEVDFGWNYNVPGDGHLYPIDCFFDSQRPMIRITTTDPSSYLSTANANPGSISSLTATLAAVADGGIRGATKTYTVTGHLVLRDATGGAPGSVTIECAAENGITIS